MESTSDVAVDLAASEDVPTPALVLADRQTAGRGRGSNRWWSAPGALTCSLLIEPASWNIAAKQFSRLSLATAAAVRDVLESLAGDKTWQLKWPNDVMVGGRKICGVLVDVPNVKRQRVVLGVGLNVNNSCRGGPRELRDSATSLCDVTGRLYDMTRVIESLLEALDERLDQLGRDDRRLAATWQHSPASD